MWISKLQLSFFFFTHYSFYWFTQHNWQEGVPNVSAIATSMLSWAGILLKYSTKWKKQKNKKTYKAFKSTPYYACSVVKLPRNMSGCQSLSRQLALQCSRNSSKGIKLNQLENFGPCHTSSSPSKPDRYINIKKKKKGNQTAKCQWWKQCTKSRSYVLQQYPWVNLCSAICWIDNAY